MNRLFAFLCVCFAIASLGCDARGARLSRAECERYVKRWFDGPVGIESNWEQLVADPATEFDFVWDRVFEECLKGNPDRIEYECTLRSTTLDQDMLCLIEGRDRRDRRGRGGLR